MATSNHTQEMKRHAVLVALAANHSDSEIANFFKVARSFVFKVRNELKASGGDVLSVAKRKKHSKRSDVVRTAEFIQQVQDIIINDPRKSMRAIAKQLNVAETTIRRVVHEDILRDHERTVHSRQGQGEPVKSIDLDSKLYQVGKYFLLLY